ncbi:reticulocyte binding protein 2 homologue a, putative [Plasmodium sp. gorilla clade G2]|uniref:reticulocyte binding protein 2 homologue a, putative n=1 Tax=Plasmodium sp. gorilla clade G2 TaxID=880535 RepID=UPI000D21F638|nr:reticulocyte binding protein 2 homologue a, putative [Plasmodium sp. gorilla clade G2]SOV17977.1 reticulocyte binding protein 2 homologue a, putative [Plasmodium sp. gorilla clade G2]
MEPEQLINENKDKWKNELKEEFNAQLKNVLEEKINDLLTKNQNELQEIDKIRQLLKKEMHELIKSKSKEEDIDKLHDRETHLRENIEKTLISRIDEEITKENQHIIKENKEEWKNRLNKEFNETLNVELKKHIDDLSDKRRKELKKIEEIEEKLKIEMPRIINEKIKASYEDIWRNKDESEEIINTKMEHFKNELNSKFKSQIEDDMKKLILQELSTNKEVIMEGNNDKWETKLDTDFKKKIDEDMRKRIDNLKKKKVDELKTIKGIRDILDKQIKDVMDKRLNVNYEKVLKDYEENENRLKSNVQKLNDLINSSLKKDMEKDLETIIIEQLNIKQSGIVKEIKEEWNQKLKTEFNQKLHDLLKKHMDELSLLKEKELKRIKEIKKQLNEPIQKMIEDELISRNDDMLKDREGLENKLESDLTRKMNELMNANNDIIEANKEVWEEKLKKEFKENLKSRINKKVKETEKISEIKEKLNKEIPKMIKSKLEKETYETLKNNEFSLKIKLESDLVTNIGKLVNEKDNIINENINIWKNKLEVEFKPILNNKFHEKANELQRIKEIRELLDLNIPKMVETTLNEKSADMLKDGQLKKNLEKDLINNIHSLVEEKNKIIHENKGEWKEKLGREFKQKLNERYNRKQNEIKRIEEIQEELKKTIPEMIENELKNENYVTLKDKESRLKNKLETDLITKLDNLLGQKDTIIQENKSAWKQKLEKEFKLILNNRFTEKEKELQKIKEITEELNELIPQMIETGLKGKDADMQKDTNLKYTMEDDLINKIDTLIGESHKILRENKGRWQEQLKSEFKPKLHSEFDKKEKELQRIKEIKQKLDDNVHTIIEEELKEKDEETLKIKEQALKYNIETILKKSIDDLTNENDNIIDRNKNTWKTKLEEEYIDILGEKFRERLSQILTKLKEEREKEEAIQRQKAEEERLKEEAIKRQKAEEERLKEEAIKRQKAEKERIQREKEEKERIQREEESKRQKAEEARKQQLLKLEQEEALRKQRELERKKVDLARTEQQIKNILESNMVKIIKQELTKEKDEIIKNRDINLRPSLEEKWLNHIQNSLLLKVDNLLNKSDEFIRAHETQMKTNILKSLKNKLNIELEKELNAIINEYEESQKKIMQSNQRDNRGIEQTTEKLVDIKPTNHGELNTNNPSDSETEMMTNSGETGEKEEEEEREEEKEPEKESETDDTHSSESTTDDDTDDQRFSRSKNLNVVIYTAGSIAVCMLIFSSVGLLVMKNNNDDNNSNVMDEAFEHNDDILFKEKEEIIEITFTDNDSTI